MSSTIQQSYPLKVKDHSVSGEEFELRYDPEFEMLTTFPMPSADELPGYYKSEDYISHTDSKRNLLEKLYHLVKGIALKKKLRLISKLSPGRKTILDVGCGTGDFLERAQKKGWSISGIEPNAEARAIANGKTDNAVFDSEHLFAYDSQSFDVITLWHVLEHLPNLDKHFATFRNILKPEGLLIIAVPNFKSYDAKQYKEFWAAFDVPRHLWHFSQTSIRRFAQKAHMDVIEIKPMPFDAFYVSLLSEKYKTGKLNYLNGFLKGLRSNWQAKRSGEYSSLIYVLKKELN